MKCGESADRNGRRGARFLVSRSFSAQAFFRTVAIALAT